jgi:hypothetical protein
MDDAFRFALMALFEANEALCRAEGEHGRVHQFTILDVPAILSLRGFRGRALRRTVDPTIRSWFSAYFEPLDPRLRTDIINPDLTKVHKYLGSRVARRIVGQPRSTVDLRELIAARKIVLVNLNAFDVGEDIAALVGGTLLNLAGRAVSGQAALPPDQRRTGERARDLRAAVFSNLDGLFAFHTTVRSLAQSAAETVTLTRVLRGQR